MDIWAEQQCCWDGLNPLFSCIINMRRGMVIFRKMLKLCLQCLKTIKFAIGGSLQLRACCNEMRHPLGFSLKDAVILKVVLNLVIFKCEY